MTSKPTSTDSENQQANRDPAGLFPVEIMGDLEARAEALLENTGGVLDVSLLPRITTPAGGGTTWAYNVLGTEQTAPQLDLIVLANIHSRAYWPDPLGEGDTRPACTSKDGVRGVGEPGGLCATCPHAQWGSSPKGTRGQACREFRVMPALVLPTLTMSLVRVPPTSARTADAYVQDLALAGLRVSQVITRATLVRAVNDGGITYAEVAFQATGTITDPRHVKALSELVTMARSAQVGTIMAETPLADAS